MSPWNDAAGAPGSFVRDINAIIRWDPDGPGPRNELLVFGGRFKTLGNSPACGVIAFDPSTGEWISLEGGVNEDGITADGVLGSGVIYTLAATPDGRLIAGGVFTQIGSATTNNIAQFDGTRWRAMLMGTTAGSSQSVRSLLVLPNGDVVAGGGFKVIGTDNVTVGPFANGISRWDGSKWNLYYRGLPRLQDPGTLALAVSDTGLLFAGGRFSTIGPFGAQHLACFPVGEWEPYGGTGPNDRVTAIVTRPNGGLVITGRFNTVADGAIRRLAVYSGGEWSPLGSELPVAVASASLLATLGDGSVGVVVNGNTMARWDDVRLKPWLATPPLVQLKAMHELPNGDIIVGDAGTRIGPDGDRYDGIAIHHDGAWRPLNPAQPLSPNGTVNTIATLTDGRALVAGKFDSAGGWTTNAAIFDGTSWAPLTPVSFTPRVALQLRDGSLVVAGARGATSTTNIAIWSSGAWFELQGGTNGTISSLTQLADGEIVAGGTFTLAGGKSVSNLARWTGSEWFPIGVGTNGPVNALAGLANGDLVVGGSFNVVGANGAGQGIMLLRGEIALPMGAGLGPSAIVNALATSASGELYAAGMFETSNGDFADRLARWTGSAWVPAAVFAVPTGTPRSVTFDEMGRMLLGGTFTLSPGAAGTGVLRLEAEGWRPLGEGVDGGVLTLAASPRLGVLAGGNFSRSGNMLVPFFSRYGCVIPACVADFDSDGFLTISDFDAFVDSFESGSVAADLDLDGQLTFEDFDAFVTAFETGC